jgi:hypothetical protein
MKTMPFGALKHLLFEPQPLDHSVEMKTMPFGALKLGTRVMVDDSGSNGSFWVEMKTMPFGALKLFARISKDSLKRLHLEKSELTVEMKTMPFGRVGFNIT